MATSTLPCRNAGRWSAGDCGRSPRSARRRGRSCGRWLALLVALLLPRLAAAAGCAPIASAEPRAWLARAADDAVRITFLGHASFLIETPQHVTALTDYNGINIPADPPDVATMNHAHPSHYTGDPDPRIPHVLRGWAEDGTPRLYDLVVRDLRVSNLPTNIRDADGATEHDGNSIFIFETAGLCIAHLSHLHHLLQPQDLDTLGRIDVVMAPVDGAYTMSQADMVRVLQQIQPRMVLPMHYFTRDVLDSFLARVRDRYAIQESASSTLRLSRATLPIRPTVVVLAGSD